MPFDARMLRSRAALRRAFLISLEREPLDAISIRDIAREAGVGSATFYRHYATKADLLDDIAAEEMKALIDAAIPVLRTTGSHEAALALCRYVDRHKKLWAALLTGGAAGAMRIEFQNRIRQVSPIPETQQLKSPEDLRLSVHASGLIEVLRWWLGERKQYKAEQIADFLYELVIGPADATYGEEKPVVPTKRVQARAKVALKPRRARRL
jgi:AcrR family transcriptional regulator